MPTWLKIVLALMGVAVLGVGSLVGAGFWWFKKNKDRLVDGGRAAQTEGEAFGQTHSKDECIDDGLGRLKECGQVDFMCEAFGKLRLKACLSVANGDGVCARVPPVTQIIKRALWANEECSRRGLAGSQPCGRFMQGVTEACAGAR